MMTMQERIDALIQMRREKPEHKSQWDRLRSSLIHERNLLTEEESAYLNKAFSEILQAELLKVWDDQFHEVLITGKMTVDYVEFPSASSLSAQGSNTSPLVDTSSLTVNKNDLISAFNNYRYNNGTK